MDVGVTVGHRFLEQFDAELARLIEFETRRQEQSIMLIASENYTSPASRYCTGSTLTNKYAEGYPGGRYYNGCQYVDEIENMARDRANQLFRAEYSNVQPHSGSQANLAVYQALLQPGDTILGMDLSHGGHLTHGSFVNASGQHYKAQFYGVEKESERIDYTQVRDYAKKYRPKMIVCGCSAYSRHIDYQQFATIAEETGAFLLADIAHVAGLIAARVHPTPLPHADVVTTSTHKTLRGPRGGMILIGKNRVREISKERNDVVKTYKTSALIDSAVMPGVQGGPLMHVIAGKAVMLKEADTKDFISYQKRTIENAAMLAQTLADGGFRIVSGGTDNHLFLVDLSKTQWTGKSAANRLEKAGIVVNKNTIPYDSRSPFVTSGIRIGTPAVTTRGMGTKEMKTIGHLIIRVLLQDDEKDAEAVQKLVVDITRGFPIHPLEVL